MTKMQTAALRKYPCVCIVDRCTCCSSPTEIDKGMKNTVLLFKQSSTVLIITISIPVREEQEVPTSKKISNPIGINNQMRLSQRMHADEQRLYSASSPVC